MRLQYCPANKGILLLNKNTNTIWHTISPPALSQHICVATILPPRRNDSFPILSQYCYLPRNFYHSSSPGSKPERLYKFLQNNSQRVLKVMPSIKYDLNGLKLNMVNSFMTLRGQVIVEGLISLTGDIVVKLTDGMYSVLLNINDKSGRMTLIGADQARSEFVASLKISNFIGEGSPSLTIGSSMTDKVSMPPTSMKITWFGNSQEITAACTPYYYEIKSRQNLTLEIQIGYEFSGKATYYPSSHNPIKLANMPHISSVGTKIITGGLATGIIIMCVFAPELAPALLLAV